MTAPVSTLISELKTLEYDLYLEGEKIRYRYLGLIDPPKDKIMPLLEEIKTHKSEAITYLKEKGQPEKDSFENLKNNLWPKLIHCSWCDLAEKERIEWEAAIKIQGQAEGTGDIKKWNEMAYILHGIAEAIKNRNVK